MNNLKLNVSGGGKLTSEDIDILYNSLQHGLISEDSSLVGQCTSDGCYEDAVAALHDRFPQFSVEALKYFVRFKDPEVLRVLLANAVHSEPNGITKGELENIKTISSWFRGNSDIRYFDELKYFKSITSTPDLQNTGLISFDLSNTKEYNPENVKNCPSVKRIGTDVDYVVYLPNVTRTAGGNCPFACNGDIMAVFMPKLVRHDPGLTPYYHKDGSFVDAGESLTYIERFVYIHGTEFVCRNYTSVPTLNSKSNTKPMYVPSDNYDAYVSGWGLSNIYKIGGREWCERFGVPFDEQYVSMSYNDLPDSVKYADYIFMGLDVSLANPE